MAFKEKPTCLECDHAFIGEKFGWCRRKAPILQDGRAAWPPVRFLDWCGEWEPGPGYEFGPVNPEDFEHLP